MGDYPKRPAFFALKFIRLMARSALANELGQEACWLLTVVATTEDAKGYRDAVTFFNEQLASAVGLGSVDALARVRAKAIAAGWLVYAPGARGRAGRYMVNVPAHLEVEDGLVIDKRAMDSDAEYPRENAAVSAEETAVNPPIHPRKRGSNAEYPRENAAVSAEPSSLFLREEEECAHTPNNSTKDRKTATRKPTGDPSAVPIPAGIDTPEFRTIWGDWQADRRARRKPLTERAARLQLADLAPLGPVAAVACVKASIAGGWTGIFAERFRCIAPPAADPPRPAVRFDPSAFDTRRYAPLTPGGKS